MHVEHAIVGAGLIGGYLAAHLADVTLQLQPDARLLVVGREVARCQFASQITISDFATPAQIRDTRILILSVISALGRRQSVIQMSSG